jgi:hypothetical protein
VNKQRITAEAPKTPNPAQHPQNTSLSPQNPTAYPFRCHQGRISVIKYTAKLQQIRGLKLKNLAI